MATTTSTARRRRVATQASAIPPAQQVSRRETQPDLDNHPHHRLRGGGGRHHHHRRHRHHHLHLHYHRHVYPFAGQQSYGEGQVESMLLSGGVPSMNPQRSLVNRLLLMNELSDQRDIALAASDQLNERIRAAALLRDRHSINGDSGSFLEEFSNLFGDDDHLWEMIGMEEWLSNARLNEGSQNDSLPSLNQGSTSLGLSEMLINLLPKEKFVPNATGSSRQDDCSICLEQFQLGQKLVCLPCNHKFHSECLRPWLESHVQCPYCRAKISIVGKGHVPCGQDDASIDDLFALMEAVDSGMSRLNIA